MEKFGARDFWHWGHPAMYLGRRDYPFSDMVTGMQNALLRQLTNGTRLDRIKDNEMRHGADRVIGIPKLMATLTDSIWSEVLAAPGENIATTRRDLQRNHLSRLARMALGEERGMPADARSIARFELKRLGKQIKARLKPPAKEFDAYTQAHLEEVVAQIDATLDASLSKGI